MPGHLPATFVRHPRRPEEDISLARDAGINRGEIHFVGKFCCHIRGNDVDCATVFVRKNIERPRIGRRGMNPEKDLPIWFSDRDRNLFPCPANLLIVLGND